jgi:hypothetical protein
VTAFQLSEQQQVRDAAGLRDRCCACGHLPADGDPLVISSGGSRIHRSHFTDESSGFYGEPFAEES